MGVERGTAEREPGGIPAFARDSTLVGEALELASRQHSGQRRKGDGRPYIAHLRAVATILAGAGVGEERLAAALLHDVVEDTPMGVEEIERRFGPHVARLVAALTEDKSISDYPQRKRAHRAQVEAAGPEAAAIYAADKLANLRDMRAVYAREGEAIASRFNAPLDTRIELWHGDLEMVERVAPELPFLRELRRELESFEQERAARRD